MRELTKLRIAVIGDVMMDHYIWGDTRRISPEAPVPVVEIEGESHTAGGAANVALNLASLGVDVSLCALVGNDEAGSRLKTLLANSGVHFAEEFQVKDFSTIIKTRVMVRKQQLCRLDSELPSVYHCPIRNGIKNAILNAVRDADAVIISDYAKGVVTQELIDQILEITRNTGVIVAVDPKPKRRLDYRGVSFMTPNRNEALELAGMDPHQSPSDFPTQEVGDKIFSIYQPESLIVTLGAEGMVVYQARDKNLRIPTAARDVYDVSGAGDTVVAVLTAARTAGYSLEDSALMANLAAGIVVGKVGTAVVSRDELLQVLPEHLKRI
jgi:D-beta-D-heptose 7-phosphate kinase/D-beta-D-heptose 1-phosphate adenosyltransferase